MRKNIKTIIYSMLIMFSILFPLNLAADGKAITGKTTKDSGYVCVDRQEYSLSEVGTAVKDLTGRITKNDIELGYLNVEGSKDEGGTVRPEYQFNATPTGATCIRKSENQTEGSYGWDTCPTINSTKNIKSINDISSNHSQLVEFGNGYQLRLNNLSGLKFKKTKNPTDNYDPNSYNIKPNANGTYTFNLGLGEQYYISFALDGGDCDGSFVGYIQGATSYTKTNEYYYGTQKTSTNTMCYNYMNKHKNNAFAQSLVPTCNLEKYDPNHITNIAGKIQEEINSAEDILKGLKSNVNNKNINLQCDFVKANNKSETYTHYEVLRTENSKYWYATCHESITIDYDTPKAVKAGGGFEYEVDLKITKVCTPSVSRVPAKKEKCKYGVECYGGPNNYSGSQGAGPTEDFDACIIREDKGKYTQKAIDKCYDEVYGDSFLSKTKKTTTKKMNNTPKKYELKQVNSFTELDQLDEWYKFLDKLPPKGYKHDATASLGDKCVVGQKYNTKNPISSCNYIANNTTCDPKTANVWGTKVCYTEHGKGVGFHNVCNSTTGQETRCYEVFLSSPKCSIDPEADYQKELKAFKAEYNNLKNLIEQESNKESNKATITSATGKKLEYGVKDNNLILEGKPVVKKTPGSNIVLDNETMPTSVYTVTLNRKIKLSKSFISRKDTGDIIYGKAPKNINDYYDGGHKYYTSINDKSYNMVDRWPNLVGNDPDKFISINNKNIVKNINFKLSNYGTWQQWKNINIDCFYGIEPSGTPPPGECDPGDPNCEIPVGPPVQASFIFRPIDLENMFPSREPRYNWSDNSAIRRDYDYLPSEIIKGIEDKGESVYSDPEELEYHFTLSPNQIRQIRVYNAQKQSYLDYNMYCNTSKENVSSCGSHFIDNGTYVTTLVKGMFGCNNQRGNGTNAVCVDSYKNIGGF